MRTPIVALLAAAAGAGLMFWKVGKDRAALQAELDQARSRLAAASAAASSNPSPSSPAAPAPPTAQPPAAAPARPSAARPAPGVDDSATRAELLKLLDEKNAKLSSAEVALAEARRRIDELEGKLAVAVKETEQLAALKKDLQDELLAAGRLAESLQAQIKGREERLAQAEVSNQDLRKRSEESAKRLGALSDLSNQMDDLTRRREGYLNNVLRRYREATELFRTLALRLDGSRDSASTTASNELSRIQQAINSADEDIRQIHALNAQSTRLQRDLAAARR